MTDFKVTDEAVQAFKHAYGQNFVDGKLIKVDERIARALEAALLVMFERAGVRYWSAYSPSDYDVLGPGQWIYVNSSEWHPDDAETLYRLKEPK